MTIKKLVSFLAIVDNDLPAFANLKNEVNALDPKNRKWRRICITWRMK
jgi:hypothetical protein